MYDVEVGGQAIAVTDADGRIVVASAPSAKAFRAMRMTAAGLNSGRISEEQAVRVCRTAAKIS